MKKIFFILNTCISIRSAAVSVLIFCSVLFVFGKDFYSGFSVVVNKFEKKYQDEEQQEKQEKEKDFDYSAEVVFSPNNYISYIPTSSFYFAYQTRTRLSGYLGIFSPPPEGFALN